VASQHPAEPTTLGRRTPSIVRFPAVAILVSTILGATLSACSRPGATLPPYENGPLTIAPRIERVADSGFPNTSGNPFRKMDVTVFEVRHGSEVLEADGEKEFWGAWALPGAPIPAVLAAKYGMALFAADATGGIRARVLVPSREPGATWQWLDAVDGQPTEKYFVGLGDWRDEPRALEGGSLILLADHLVLDVSTLQTHAFDLRYHVVDDYNAAGTPARALSPARTQIVFVGDRYRDDHYEYAVVTHDFVHDETRALPIERTRMRFDEPDDATPAWLAHYFEWKTTPDGRERLEMRTGVAPLPWQGKLVELGGGAVEYRLRPVGKDMAAVLEDFLRSSVHAARSPDADAMGHSSWLVDDVPVAVWFDEEHRTVSLWVESRPGFSLSDGAPAVRKIASAFDAVLAGGAYEDRFLDLKGSDS